MVSSKAETKNIDTAAARKGRFARLDYLLSHSGDHEALNALYDDPSGSKTPAEMRIEIYEFYRAEAIVKLKKDYNAMKQEITDTEIASLSTQKILEEYSGPNLFKSEDLDRIIKEDIEEINRRSRMFLALPNFDSPDMTEHFREVDFSALDPSKSSEEMESEVKAVTKVQREKGDIIFNRKYADNVGVDASSAEQIEIEKDIEAYAKKPRRVCPHDRPWACEWKAESAGEQRETIKGLHLSDIYAAALRLGNVLFVEEKSYREYEPGQKREEKDLRILDPTGKKTSGQIREEFVQAYTRGILPRVNSYLAKHPANIWEDLGDVIGIKNDDYQRLGEAVELTGRRVDANGNGKISRREIEVASGYKPPTMVQNFQHAVAGIGEKVSTFFGGAHEPVANRGGPVMAPA